jgi:hypothetical protein
MIKKTSSLAMAFVVAMAIAPCLTVLAANSPEVTIKNYARAETDLQMRTFLDPNDEADVKAGQPLLDAISVRQADKGKWEDPGWNYIVRMYRPRQEILDGTWKFPIVKSAESK